MAATALLNNRLNEFQRGFYEDPEATDLRAFNQLILDMRANGEKMKVFWVDIPKKSAMGERLHAFYSDAQVRFPELPPIQWASKASAEHRDVDDSLKKLNAATMAATRNNPFAALAAMRDSL